MVNIIQGEDLNIRNIDEVWREGKDFKDIREKIRSNNCNNCKFFNICHGGCRIFNINEKQCIK